MLSKFLKTLHLHLRVVPKGGTLSGVPSSVALAEG